MTGTEGRRPRKRIHRRHLLGALSALVLACGLGVGAAWAYWSAEAAPGGNGAAVAATVDQGATPVATVAGTSVTVSWAASSLSDASPVDGYVVSRYDVDTDTPQPLLASCAGTLTALTCTEDDVPEGHWVYSVTPTLATHWRGPESVRSSPVWVDTTPPVNAVTLSDVTGDAVRSGDTVYYRGVAAGSFTLTNTLSDTGSGPASSTTADLAGPSMGWSHTASTASTPTGGPFVSAPFDWDPDTDSSPDEVVTGSDGSGNSTVTTLSFVDDSEGPSGGSVTATGLGGTGFAYTASTSASLTLVKGTDASGVASTGNLLQRAAATLTSDGTSDGVCGPYGDFATVTGGTDPSSTKVDTGLVTGCYLYQYVVTDRLGNSTTYTSGEVRVDTTAPGAPTRTFQTSGSTYWNGISSLVYYRSTAASGSFTVTASATDPASGILRYTFPAAFGTGWTATPGDLDEMTYSWSGTPQTVSAKSITATNHANKTSPVSATFTPTADTTVPTAGSVSYLNRATAGTTVDVTFTSGTDAGSGLAAKVLERASAPLTNGVCGTFGAFDPIATDPVSPYTDTVETDTCYMYDYETPDNVGNQRTNASASIVKVSEDVTGPSGGSLTATGLGGTGSAYSTSTSVNLTFSAGTDPSGVATSGNLLQRASAPLLSTNGADGVCGNFGNFATVTNGTDPSSPFTNTLATTAFCWRYQYVVKDNLANATTYTSGDVKVDTSVPSTPTRTFNTFDNTWWPNTGNTVYYRSNAPSGSFRVTASATDAQSGIVSYTFPTAATFGAGWSATPGDLNEMTYSWSGAPAAPGSKTITANNHALLPSLVSTVFTPTVDNTAPTGGTATYPNGGTPNTSVTVALGTVTDAGSGVASKLLQRNSAPLTAGTCGTFTAYSTIATNPVGTTYTDSSLTMDTCYQYQYVATDNVGNQVSSVPGTNVVKVSTDVTGPTGGSVAATGLGGTGSTYSTSTSVNLTLVKGTDPSGVATSGNLLQRASAQLISTGGANGVCGGFGSFITVTGGTDPTSPKVDVTTTAFCYRYQYLVKDDLGNTTTYTSADVKVDTTAPTTPPSRTFGSFNNVYWDTVSTSVFYRSNAATGSFTVTASGAVDGQSGIAAYNFPALGTNWTSTPGAFGVNTYSWSGAPAAPGSKTITATNHATGPVSGASTAFVPTADNTAPTGGTASYPNGGTPNTSVTVTLGTVTDGTGSGVASKLLQRSSAPLTAGTCGTPTAYSTIVTNPVGTTYTDSTLVMDTCYTYQYVATDNLGNQATGTSPNIVKVSSDVAGPTGGSITATGLGGTGSAYAASTSVNLTFSARAPTPVEWPPPTTCCSEPRHH